MNVTEKFVDLVEKSPTIFDLISSFMDCLIESIENEEQFRKDYIDNEYYSVFAEFEAFVAKQCQDYDNCLFFFNRIKNQIVNQLYKIDLYVSHEDEGNVSYIAMYHVLKAIDEDVVGWEVDSFEKTGPLDQEKHRYRVYLNIRKKLNLKYEEGVGREPSTNYSLRTDFKNLVFLDSYSWGAKKTKSIPRGVIVTTKAFRETQKLRVGVSHMSCDDPNVIIHKGDDEFSVSYKKDQSKYVELVQRTIEKAIEEKCDILVFPEYCGSPSILKNISNSLRSLFFEGKKTPVLTIAGSTWTTDSNNVSYAYDQQGFSLGSYYKYAPYRYDVPIPNSDEVKTIKEPLLNRGKVCDNYFVEGLGLVLPSICRDAWDTGYTNELIETFFPTLTVIPACTSSIKDFDRHLVSYVDRYFTSSILVGYCNAVAKSNKNVGSCYLVHKIDTTASHICGFLSREDCCKSSCTNGCLNVVEFNFAYAALDSNPKKAPLINTTLFINGKEIECEKD